MVKSIFMSCFTSLFYVPTLKKQEISMRWLSIYWEAFAKLKVTQKMFAKHFTFDVRKLIIA